MNRRIIDPTIADHGDQVESGVLVRLAAFTRTPSGGNPAGVWIGERFPTDNVMQSIAADIGYSETVFAVPREEPGLDVRYFSPLAEVPFCGHATIALGGALGTRDNDQARYELHTIVGPVRLDVSRGQQGTIAALTSVPPSHRDAPPGLVETTLGLLGWDLGLLDTTIPPTVAYAGAHHLVLAITQRSTLTTMSYDFAEMQDLMEKHDLTTLQLVWRESSTVFHVRNPFPVGGVVEDPATGAAAAAFGGYLRDAGLIVTPVELTLHQGVDLGRPSELTVTVPPGDVGITVAGSVVPIER